MNLLMDSPVLLLKLLLHFICHLSFGAMLIVGFLVMFASAFSPEKKNGKRGICMGVYNRMSFQTVH